MAHGLNICQKHQILDKEIRKVVSLVMREDNGEQRCGVQLPLPTHPERLKV